VSHIGWMRRIALLVLIGLTAGCTGTSTGQVPGLSTTTQASEVKSPGLNVETVAGGLEHGWDIGFLPDGQVLVTQRPGKLALLSSSRPGATVTQVQADFSDVLRGR